MDTYLEKLNSILYTLDKVHIHGIENIDMMSGCMHAIQEIIVDMSKHKDECKTDSSK